MEYETSDNLDVIKSESEDYLRSTKKLRQHEIISCLIHTIKRYIPY